MDNIYQYLINSILYVDSLATRRLSQKGSPMFIFAVLGIFSLGLLVFRSGFISAPDSAMHIFNVQQYAREISVGVFYPRWLGDWYGGYGAPIGVVYSPLLYTLAGLLVVSGLKVGVALKVIVLFSVILSGYFLYKFTGLFYRPAGALLAGVVYQFAPYRMFDLYGRGALPEYIAFMWMPLLLYITCRYISTKKISWMVSLSLGFACLIFTHLQIAILFSPVYALMAFYFWWISSERSLRELLGLSTGLLLGLAVSALYWLPALLESKYINTGWLQTLTPGQLPVNQEWGNYLNNFLFSAQVYQGTDWQTVYKDNLQIGIGAVSSFLVIVWAVLLTYLYGKRKKEQSVPALLMAFGSLIGMFMSFKLSEPLWSMLPGLEIIQFPWRWQTITVLVVAFLSGHVVDMAVGSAKEMKTDRGPMMSAHFLSFVFLFLYCALGIFTMLKYRGSMPDYLISQFDGSRELQIENYEWVFDDLYVPRWALGFDYAKDPASDGKVTAAGDQDLKTNIKEISFGRMEIDVFSVGDAVINVRSFWFPGWVAYVNGLGSGIKVNQADGTMLIIVPGGTSQVVLVFEDTPVRSTALGISMIGLILLAVNSLYYWISRRYWAMTAGKV